MKGGADLKFRGERPIFWGACGDQVTDLQLEINRLPPSALLPRLQLRRAPTT
jgi:hypothetical protein